MTEAGEILLSTSARYTVRRVPERGVVRKTPAGATHQARLQHEIGVLQRLAGLPGVPKLFDAGARGRWMETEWVDGQRLDSWALGVSERDRLVVAHDLICAVQSIHARGVVHGDLKASNVLVAGRGRVVVLDFELAGIDGTPPAGGTLGRLAPELHYLPDSRLLDFRVDVYALGLLLRGLFTGDWAPVSGDVLWTTLTQDGLGAHMKTPEFKTVDAHHMRLQAAMTVLLAPWRQDRPRSLEVVRNNLAALLAEHGLRAVGPDLPHYAPAAEAYDAERVQAIAAVRAARGGAVAAGVATLLPEVPYVLLQATSLDLAGLADEVGQELEALFDASEGMQSSRRGHAIFALRLGWMGLLGRALDALKPYEDLAWIDLYRAELALTVGAQLTVRQLAGGLHSAREDRLHAAGLAVRSLKDAAPGEVQARVEQLVAELATPGDTAPITCGVGTAALVAAGLPELLITSARRLDGEQRQAWVAAALTQVDKAREDHQLCKRGYSRLPTALVGALDAHRRHHDGRLRRVAASLKRRGLPEQPAPVVGHALAEALSAPAGALSWDKHVAGALGAVEAGAELEHAAERAGERGPWHAWFAAAHRDDLDLTTHATVLRTLDKLWWPKAEIAFWQVALHWRQGRLLAARSRLVDLATRGQAHWTLAVQLAVRSAERGEVRQTLAALVAARQLGAPEQALSELPTLGSPD